mmetsp:Transcript_3369/g.8694  ORF Transcript_3369/g.8694 Transcript_3369/m.8694 type:complete len:213 (-) Transcript_3369:387-1025(-)
MSPTSMPRTKRCSMRRPRATLTLSSHCRGRSSSTAAATSTTPSSGRTSARSPRAAACCRTARSPRPSPPSSARSKPSRPSSTRPPPRSRARAGAGSGTTRPRTRSRSRLPVRGVMPLFWHRAARSCARRGAAPWHRWQCAITTHGAFELRDSHPPLLLVLPRPGALTRSHRHPSAGEHAYYLQYKNVRPEYLKQIWSIVNWKDVEARYLAAK